MSAIDKLMEQIVSNKYDEVLQDVKEEIKSKSLKPKIAIIRVGENSENDKHIYKMINMLNDIYISYVVYGFEECDNLINKQKVMYDIANIISNLNSRRDICGIYIQFESTKSFDKYDKHYLIELIDPRKDINGLTEYNRGRLYINPDSKDCIIKSQVMAYYNAILILYGDDLKDKSIILFGNEDTDYRSLWRLLDNRKANVTVINNSKTKNQVKIYDKLAMAYLCKNILKCFYLTNK